MRDTVLRHPHCREQCTFPVCDGNGFTPFPSNVSRDLPTSEESPVTRILPAQVYKIFVDIIADLDQKLMTKCCDKGCTACTRNVA
jgi:hypothetical protein